MWIITSITIKKLEYKSTAKYTISLWRKVRFHVFLFNLLFLTMHNKTKRVLGIYSPKLVYLFCGIN